MLSQTGNGSADGIIGLLLESGEGSSSGAQVFGSRQGRPTGNTDSLTLARKVSFTLHSPRGPDGVRFGVSGTVFEPTWHDTSPCSLHFAVRLAWLLVQR